MDTSLQGWLYTPMRRFLHQFIIKTIGEIQIHFALDRFVSADWEFHRILKDSRDASLGSNPCLLA